MPTSARLVAALCLGALAWIVTDQVMAVMPSETNFGYFRVVNVVLGLVCGWFVIGGRVGTSYVTAFSIGLTGVFALVFWALFAQAGNEMMRLAMKHRYDGPFEATVAVFEIGVDFAGFLMHANIFLTLGVGGVVAGLAAEFASRRWT